MRTKRIIVVTGFLILVAITATCSECYAQKDHIDAFRDVGMGRGLTVFHAADNSGDLPKLIKGSAVIDLYDDYAVMKDRYILLNGTDKVLKMSCGLPKSGYFQTSIIDSVKFLPLSYLAITLNGQMVSSSGGQVADSLTENERSRGIREWYISNLKLRPGKSVLEVSYLVNTHDAKMISGHNIEHSHGLGYMLSTLNSWNGQADYRILIISKLTGGEPMQGIYPLHGFKTSGNKYVYDLKLSRDAVPHNIVIRYGNVSMYSPKHKSHIQGVTDPGQMIGELNRIDPWNIKADNYHPVYLDNFRPFPSASFSIGGTILAFALLIGTVLFFIIRSGMGQIRQMNREKEDRDSIT